MLYSFGIAHEKFCSKISAEASSGDFAASLKHSVLYGIGIVREKFCSKISAEGRVEK